MLTFKNQKKKYKILRKNSSTFYLAGLLLPKDKLDKAASLYSFCRWVDDVADEAKDSYRASYYLGKISASLYGQGHVDNLVNEIKIMLKKGPGGVLPAVQLINTVRTDLGTVRINNERDLIKYCYGVAGTVGVMMCTVLQVKDVKKAYKHAIDMGIAMQLTNICRDVREDASFDRRYLPGDLVNRITPDEILKLNSKNDLVIREAIQKLLLLAEIYYESGMNGIRFLPTRSRFGICAAATFYRSIGRLMLKQDCKGWRNRTFVSNTKKLGLLFAVLKQFIEKSCGPESSHNKKLHAAIGEECRSIMSKTDTTA